MATLAELAKAYDRAAGRADEAAKELAAATATVARMKKAFDEAHAAGAKPAELQRLANAVRQAEKDETELSRERKTAAGQLRRLGEAYQRNADAQEEKAKAQEARKPGFLTGVSRAARAVRSTAGGARRALSGAVGGAVGLAGGAGVGMIGELAGQLKGFVEALSPASTALFGRVMKDLSAVIGTAVLPVFQVLTQGVRQFADLLLPVAEELAPVFGQLAQTALSVLQPIMQVFANAVRAVAPLLQLFADVLAGLSPVLTAWYTVVAAFVRTLGDFIKSMFGEGYKDGMKAFQAAMQKLAGQMLVGAGALVKFAASLGFVSAAFADKFLANLIKAAEGGPKKPSEGLGAATGARFSSFADFGKHLMTSAFTATRAGSGDDKTDNQWLKDAAKTLKEIRSGNKDAALVLEGIKDAVVKAASDVIERIGEEIGVRILAGVGETFGPKTEADARKLTDRIKAGMAGGPLGLAAQIASEYLG